MLKLLLLLPLLFLTLIADDKIEIYASTMDSKDDIVEASGGVTVMYKEYFLTAQKAIYNRKSGDLELFNNIRVNHGSSYKILGEYAKLNIAKKERLFKPFYMLDRKSKVWMSAAEGNTKNDDIIIEAGSLSGCNPVDPIWRIDFSESNYNSDTKWLNIYNARLYIDDIPIFYTPYFGYSLDTKRRTGLLMPALGLSDSEGIFYEQPLYIAEYDSWDLEIKPQIRTQRGQGIYQTFRFVDSETSHGEFTAGYFKENTQYFADSKLQNDSHYGFDFKYDNRDFMNQWLGTSLEGQSGLYVDINHMNDVDYINLSSNDIFDDSTSTQVLSRINMFYNTDDHYVGAYFKYYQDLTLSSNDDTLQKLPTFQYHYYLDTLLEDHILYSLDVQSNNIERNINKKVIQTDVNLPVTIQTSLFDEYLNVSYRANLYMQHSKFSGSEEVPSGIEFNDGYFMRNYHTLAASSQLTRGYEDFSHVVGLGISYNTVGVESKNGFYSDNDEFCSDEINQDRPECEFFNISTINDEAQIDFIQYIYDDNGKELIYHRLAQKVSYSNSQDTLGELENELDYKITDYLSFYNNMFYNYGEKLFSKVYNKIDFNKYGLNLALSHLTKDTFLPGTTTYPRYTSYLTSSAAYTYNKHYSYGAKYNYDIQTQEKKSMEIGFVYKKRCWDFGITYSENNRPILTQTGEDSIYDRYIFFTIALKPLMQSDGSSLIRYQLPENN